MRYRAILFDFDFTLADATPGIVLCANHALAALGFAEKPTGDIRKTVGMTLENTFHTLSGSPNSALAEQFSALFIAKADEVMTENTVLFDDCIPALTALRENGCKLGIVTSKFRYRIVQALEKYGVPQLVDFIIGFEDVQNHKPAPDGLLDTLAHFGVAPREALFVGDSLIDAQTAARAGVDFAAVLTGETAAAEFAALPRVFTAQSLTALADWLSAQ